MENLEDLELEDMKALGLYIEKCVDEVLRSHLVERPPNTTKNYVPKTEGVSRDEASTAFRPGVVVAYTNDGHLRDAYR
jgi:hypothetical protein